MILKILMFPGLEPGPLTAFRSASGPGSSPGNKENRQ